MSYAFPPNLARLIEARMASGDYASEDDLLVDAMIALSDIEERKEALRAEIQRRVARAGTPLSQPLDLERFKAEARLRFGVTE